MKVLGGEQKARDVVTGFILVMGWRIKVDVRNLCRTFSEKRYT
jgi:hypothetical protein